MHKKELNIFEEIWGELSRAKVDVKHSFRYPVLSTIGRDNWPEARTLVLRDVARNTNRLIFFTDVRSPKVNQLQQNSRTSVAFYNHKKKMQLRLKGFSKVLQSVQTTQKYFNNIVQTDLRDYRSVKPPGAISGEEVILLPKEDAKDNFCVIDFEVIKMDYLQLSKVKHERVAFKYENNAWSSQQVVP